MASPASEHLDDALKNRSTLLSWKAVFGRLTASPNTFSQSLSDYMLSPSQLKTLTQSYAPFSLPSSASKQAFETKTAAINFDSTDQQGPLPPISHLKNEALALSKSLNIDELAALRIVVLEYQSRDNAALLKASSTPSSQDGGLFSFANNYIVNAGDTETDAEKAEKALQRRITIYLTERRYVIKCAKFLVRASFTKGNAWKQAGKRLVSELQLGDNDTMKMMMKIIRKRVVQGEGDAPQWVKNKVKEDTDVLIQWEKQVLLEIIHLLQLMFLLCYRTIEITGSTATAWFKLMDETAFFNQIHTPAINQLPDIQNLNSYLHPLCSIISLTILSLHKVDDYLIASFTQDNPAPPTGGVAFEDNAFYLKSPNAIAEVTQILTEHARNPVASLASFGWSLILRRIGECLYSIGHDPEDIETPTPEPSAFATPARRRRTGNAAADLYISSLSTIYVHNPHGKSVAAFLAKSAISDCHVFDLIVQLVTSVATEGNGGIAWSIGHEEDGKSMKAVIATVVRKATEVVEFSQGIVSAVLVLNEVPISEAWKMKHPSEPHPFSLDNEQDPLDTSQDSMATNLCDTVAKFWSDPEALTKIMIPARARFPYEPLPFLKIIRSLATDVERTHAVLTKMDTYTQALPVGFGGYEIGLPLNNNLNASNFGFASVSGNGSATGSVDDSDAGWIVLAEELCLFAPRMISGYETGEDEVGGGGLVLLPDTHGRVISDNRTVPPIVMWQFRYSALTLFGRILECALIGASGGGSSAIFKRGSNGAVVDPAGTQEVIGEIISILTTMILASCSSGSSSEHAEKVTLILEETSDAVGRNRDVVSIIFDLLEDALQASCRASATQSTEFITIGLQFVNALVPILPNRVWPYLARSSLLERHGKEGTLIRITSGIEVVKGEYDFTCTALRLFEDLVEDGIRGAVEKSGVVGGNGVVVFAKKAGVGAGVSASVQREILEEWTHWGVDLFESYQGWKYLNGEEKSEIGRRITKILTRILDAVYGVDDSMDLKSKITGLLASSAEHLTKVFLSDSTTTLPLQPIVSAIHDGVTIPESSLYVKPLHNWVFLVTSIMQFAATLVRVRAYIGLPPSQLETQLYEISPFIAKLYAVHDRFRLPVVDLIEAMISASGTAPANTDLLSSKRSPEPPSLLGHLGTECASAFTQVLSALDSPLHEIELETKIWNLISAIVSNRQQGMSILLLRGETLLGGFSGNSDHKTAATTTGVKKNNSILTVALDELSDTMKLDNQPEKALAMLETVALSQNYWSLAMEDMGRHPNFLSSMVKYVESFNVEFQSSDTKETATMKANKVAVVANIARILAMHIHTKRASSSRHEPGFIAQLLNPNTLRFYFQNGVTISGYRPSLHGHLGKNFEDKWPGLGLMKLKRTKLRKRAYGTGYFYNLGLASQVLGFDKFWESDGASGRTATSAKSHNIISGYREEVEQANLNLSLIDSQVVLLRAWKLLAMELCPFAFQNAELSKSLIKVVESCLQANIDSWHLPAPIAKIIFAERAEFAFILMRRLSQQPIRSEDGRLYEGVLKFVWKAILNQRADFRRALSTGEEINYYRSLLRILYMALLAQQNRTDSLPVELCYLVLDMLNLVVAQGFMDLAQAAQAHPETSNPEDIALITGILQASFKLKGIEVIHSGISMHIFDQGTIRAATTLYSWAEQIGATENGHNDPAYGELAVLFLLEMSYVPLLAEQLAVEPLLELLLTSSLSHTIRSSMTAGLNNPLQHHRLHSIWSRGLLPIMVNLLIAIGPRIGPDVVRFLSFFGTQVEGLVNSWGQRGNAITLASVRETSTLVGLLEILRAWGVDIPSPKSPIHQQQQFNDDTEMMRSSTNGGISEELTTVFGGQSNTELINGIRFDKGIILEGVEYLLNHRNYLASLVVPTTLEEEEESAVVEKTEDKAGVSKLVEKVIKEMDILRKLLTVVIGDEAEKA
ncbi:nucleoporin subcomplex protein binding to Pom34-domain-containing protein [Kalaharituber pfeilii]|nr:nucleoporin subcomplex protein binding to Pom34-domain-containing protein [Kalaharituber pfeilii]